MVCIGAGNIGAGWVAQFLIAGLDVVVYDPAPEREAWLDEYLGSGHAKLGTARPCASSRHKSGAVDFRFRGCTRWGEVCQGELSGKLGKQDWPYGADHGPCAGRGDRRVKLGWVPSPKTCGPERRSRFRSSSATRSIRLFIP
nr:3-hydroxyacyl-CoA dehydrogenase NAD-binding domain-containing protein [Sinorhizobium meliloti]